MVEPRIIRLRIEALSQDKRMSITTILLILLILAVFGGGNFLGGAYAGPGNIVGLVLVVLLVVLLVRGL